MFLLASCSLWHITQRCPTTARTSAKLGVAGCVDCADGADGDCSAGASDTATTRSESTPPAAYSHGTRLACTSALWRATKEWRISAPASITSASTSQLWGAP